MNWYKDKKETYNKTQERNPIIFYPSTSGEKQRCLYYIKLTDTRTQTSFWKIGLEASPFSRWKGNHKWTSEYVWSIQWENESVVVLEKYIKQKYNLGAPHTYPMFKEQAGSTESSEFDFLQESAEDIVSLLKEGSVKLGRKREELKNGRYISFEELIKHHTRDTVEEDCFLTWTSVYSDSHPSVPTQRHSFVEEYGGKPEEISYAVRYAGLSQILKEMNEPYFIHPVQKYSAKYSYENTIKPILKKNDVSVPELLLSLS